MINKEFLYYLLKQNKLTEEQIQLCLSQKKPLSEFLVEKRYLSPENLSQLVQEFEEFHQRPTLYQKNLHEGETDLLKEIELIKGQKPDIDDATTPPTIIGTVVETETTLNPKLYPQVKSNKDAKEESAFEPLFAKEEDEEQKRYEVLENLGEGGMGVVQLVQDNLLKRKVALKKIKVGKKGLSQLSNTQQILLWRLHKEAEITAILEHPNIVPLYDMHEKASGELYFTMRKIEGETLNSIIKKMREEKIPKNEERLLSIFSKVCDAISYAHNQGVIHRDLKPENIMVGQFGEVYVMDWGIAKKRGPNIEKTKIIRPLDPISDSTFHTIGGIGTQGYMAPEQAEDASEVKPQADIYALGKILRECFTLYSPLEEFKALLELNKTKKRKYPLQKRLTEIPAAHKMPQDLQAIIEKATAEEWKNRYSSVQELAVDVEHYRENVRVSARSYSPLEIMFKWGIRNWKRILIVSFIFFLCLFFGIYSIFLKKKVKKNYDASLARLEKTRFEEAFQLAKKEKQKAFQQSEEEIGPKMEHLLKALYHLNNALATRPEEPRVEQKKFAVGKHLIQLACKSQDYQLAYYLLKELELLASIGEKKKQLLKIQVEEEKSKILRQHLKRLQYWKKQLNQRHIKPKAQEDAIFEISKMPEIEIFEALTKIIQEGTHYYSDNKNRSARRNEYFNTMANAFGRLGNPKAAPFLFKALEQMNQRLFPLKQRPNADIEYMVTLFHALRNSKAKGYIFQLQNIRHQMGQNQLFGKRTEVLFKDMLEHEELEQYSTIKPSDYYLRATLKLVKEDFESAIQDFNKTIELNPKFVPAYINRGIAFFSKRKLAEAIQDFSQAIQLDSQSPSAYFNRGKAKQMKRDWNAAIKDYSQTIQLAPQNFEAYHNRAVIRAVLGEREKALADYQKAIQLYPQNTGSYLNRGALKDKMGDYRGALYDYNKAIEIDPEFTEAYFNRGVFSEKRGDLKKALQDLSKVIQLNPQFSNAYLTRGNIKSKQGDLSGALEDFNQAIQQNPKNINAYIHRGVLKSKLKEYQKAIVDYTQAIHLNPQNSLAFYNRGQAKNSNGDYDGAISDYTTALRLNSKYQAVYFSRGETKYNKGDLKGAKKDYLLFLETTFHRQDSGIQNARKTVFKRFPELQRDYQKKQATEKVKNYLAQGLKKYKQGDLISAKEEFRNYLELTQNSTNPLILKNRQAILKKFPDLK